MNSLLYKDRILTHSPQERNDRSVLEDIIGKRILDVTNRAPRSIPGWHGVFVLIVPKIFPRHGYDIVGNRDIFTLSFLAPLAAFWS